MRHTRAWPSRASNRSARRSPPSRRRPITCRDSSSPCRARAWAAKSRARPSSTSCCIRPAGAASPSHSRRRPDPAQIAGNLHLAGASKESRGAFSSRAIATHPSPGQAMNAPGPQPHETAPLTRVQTDLNPDTLSRRSPAGYRLGKGLQEMIRENLVAERIAIDSYREMVQYVGDDDPTTRRMLEGILATEEEHADDLADLLQDAAGNAAS